MGAGIYSLNRGISLNRDSLNQDLSVLGSFYEAKISKSFIFQKEWRINIFQTSLLWVLQIHSGQKMEKLLQELMFCTIYCNIGTKT